MKNAHTFLSDLIFEYDGMKMSIIGAGQMNDLSHISVIVEFSRKLLNLVSKDVMLNGSQELEGLILSKEWGAESIEGEDQLSTDMVERLFVTATFIHSCNRG